MAVAHVPCLLRDFSLISQKLTLLWLTVDWLWRALKFSTRFTFCGSGVRRATARCDVRLSAARFESEPERVERKHCFLRPRKDDVFECLIYVSYFTLRTRKGAVKTYFVFSIYMYIPGCEINLIPRLRDLAS